MKRDANAVNAFAEATKHSILGAVESVSQAGKF